MAYKTKKQAGYQQNYSAKSHNLPHGSFYSPLLLDMSLQRTIGNQEVQRMFRAGEILAKLYISQPEDAYEQEADTVAQQIVNLAEQDIQSKTSSTVIQKKASSPGREVPSPQTEAKIRSLQGSGQPLEPKLRDYFQPRFGVDLQDVRIHTDSNADKLARAVRARAFTLGHDVVFAKGEYQPGSHEGKKLVAHELTHVLQQRQGISRTGKSFIQRDIKGTGTVTNGEFEIDMVKKEIPPELKAGEEGTVKFTPDATSPATNDIGLIQIVKVINHNTTPSQDYIWTGGESDRNSVMTSATPITYNTVAGDTLKTISQSQTNGHITLREIYTQNKVILGTFDENRAITAATTLNLPRVQAGYFVDHLASSTTATPRANATANDVPLYYRDYAPSPTVSQDGHKKSATDIVPASLWDFPGAGSSFHLTFCFETVARSKDMGFDYGTIHWGFTMNAGTISDEYYHMENGTSPTFKAAIAEFNKFYKNHHIVVDGDTLSGLAKLYFNDSSRWSEIQTANGLTGTTITKGQTLIIPGVTKI